MTDKLARPLSICKINVCCLCNLHNYICAYCTIMYHPALEPFIQGPEPSLCRDGENGIDQNHMCHFFIFRPLAGVLPAALGSAAGRILTDALREIMNSCIKPPQGGLLRYSVYRILWQLSHSTTFPDFIFSRDEMGKPIPHLEQRGSLLTTFMGQRTGKMRSLLFSR